MNSPPRVGTFATLGLMFCSVAASDHPASGREAKKLGTAASDPLSLTGQFDWLDRGGGGFSGCPQDKSGPAGGAWVTLMFENSTVCHSRRISLFCPVTMACGSFW